MDEYTSEIFMGGKNTIVLHNTCEDSLLAAPLILDLVILAELCTRIEMKKEGEVIMLYIWFCQKFVIYVKYHEFSHGNVFNICLDMLLDQDKFHSFHPVATLLSYLTKAPLVS